MPLSSAHQLYYPQPNPQTFEDVATDFQNIQRWSRELPFFPVSRWMMKPESTVEVVPFGGVQTLSPINVNHAWIDFTTVQRAAWLKTKRGCCVVFQKHDFDTAIHVTVSVSGFTNVGGSQCGLYLEVESLERTQIGIGAVSPYDVFSSAKQIITAFTFNNALVHHTLPFGQIIVPPCPAGWWVLEFTGFTSATGPLYINGDDLITITAQEVPPPPAYYTGAI